MPGFLLHQGAVVLCSHTGQCTPTTVFPRVTVGGMPVVQQPTIYSIAGCVLPPSAGGPCVTGQWITAATRVLVGGIPPLLFDSASVCTPTGTPMQPVSSQMRTSAQ